MEKFSTLKGLRPLPPVASALMRLVAQDNVALGGIANLIRADPAFSAEVLRVANSPLLNCRRSVHSILHALAMLGLERLKSLVMTVAVRQFMSSILVMPAAARCWRHSLASAIMSQEIALSLGMREDFCYTAALLHDMGRLAMLRAAPDKYSRLLDESAGSELEILATEQAEFGFDHGEAGCWLVEQWQFPETYTTICGRHHHERAAGALNEIAVVFASCRIVATLGFQATRAEARQDLAFLSSTGLPPKVWERFMPEEEASFELARKINAVECSLV